MAEGLVAAPEQLPRRSSSKGSLEPRQSRTRASSVCRPRRPKEGVMGRQLSAPAECEQAAPQVAKTFQPQLSLPQGHPLENCEDGMERLVSEDSAAPEETKEPEKVERRRSWNGYILQTNVANTYDAVNDTPSLNFDSFHLGLQEPCKVDGATSDQEDESSDEVDAAGQRQKLNLNEQKVAVRNSKSRKSTQGRGVGFHIGGGGRRRFLMSRKDGGGLPAEKKASASPNEAPLVHRM
eukprot:TRINITY_DN66347_c0_g1_i1.p1 TRINITY_DN66347_c0_g1~~TRINITY_DN66347_c0_g1_i1.p1  ORF type:complete len:237 (+),score=36.95 TRINITY_DN66347_c0_g1_i1:81-791(+)